VARTSRTGTRTDLALLGVALTLSVLSLLLPTQVRERVQGTLRATIVSPLVAAQSWAERGRLSIRDHGRLVNSVDSLAVAVQASSTLRAENERLRRMIGLGQRVQWGWVASEVIYPPRGGDQHSVMLGVGSAAGVRPFSPLVVPEGLVGMVNAVEAASSTAILWTHPDFRASATTVDGAAFGIIAAHLGSGADRYLLEMRGVPFRSELKPGTLIVTSGLGNVFPRGIPIGVVLRETKTVEGWARTYLLRPIVAPDAASSVMVLLPARAAAGVAEAWSSAAAAEATQRSVVAAGDSILADSVRKIEAQLATLSRLDSLRRAAIFAGDSGVRIETDSSVAPARPAVAPTVGTGTLDTTRVTPVAAPTARPRTRPRPDTARARVRADSIRAKASADSAAARTRSNPPARPQENPFRLPPSQSRL
jgi:rod shape-determining protein MreC